MITAGLHRDIPEDQYHADRQTLSHSGAKLLLRAPAIYRHRLDNPEHSDVFDFGTAAHKLVLGVGRKITVIDAPDWRTKAAREAKQAARDAGEIPLLDKDWQTVRAMADKLSEHRLAMRLLSAGQPEVSAYAVDEQTGITLRGRVDWLGDTVISDYKSAASSEPDTFVRAAIKYGYDSQHAWYLDLLAACGHPAEAFAFIVQEKEPPYLVTVIELPAELVDRGRARNRRAIERYRDCTEAGQWPGYISDDQFAQPEAPAWALREDISA